MEARVESRTYIRQTTSFCDYFFFQFCVPKNVQEATAYPVCEEDWSRTEAWRNNLDSHRLLLLLVKFWK